MSIEHFPEMLVWDKLRLTIVHDPHVSLDAGAKRDKRIGGLKAQVDQCVGKLNDQGDGNKMPGRKLSGGGVRAKFYREVCGAHLSRIVRIDLKSNLFTYNIDMQSFMHNKMMNSKLFLGDYYVEFYAQGGSQLLQVTGRL